MERFHTQRYFMRITCLVTAILFGEYLFSQETTIQTLPVEEANLGVVTVQEAGLEFRYEIYPQRIMIGDPIFVRCQVTNQTGKNWDDFPIVPDTLSQIRAHRARYQITEEDPLESKSLLIDHMKGLYFGSKMDRNAEQRGCLTANETITWWESQIHTDLVLVDHQPRAPEVLTYQYQDFRYWLSQFPEENGFRLNCGYRQKMRISDTIELCKEAQVLLTIDLRSEEELQAIKTWVHRHGKNLYGSYQHFRELNTPLAELQEFEQQLSPGTFRDEIHKEILIKRLLAAENPELFVQISNEMLTWLEMLPELQQRGLAREIIPCIEALKERDQSKFTSDQTFAFTDENIEDIEQRIRSILE